MSENGGANEQQAPDEGPLVETEPTDAVDAVDSAFLIQDRDAWRSQADFYKTKADINEEERKILAGLLGLEESAGWEDVQNSAHSTISALQAQNAAMRVVVEAAKAVYDDQYDATTTRDREDWFFTNKPLRKLRQALAALNESAEPMTSALTAQSEEGKE